MVAGSSPAGGIPPFLFTHYHAFTFFPVLHTHSSSPFSSYNFPPSYHPCKQSRPISVGGTQIHPQRAVPDDSISSRTLRLRYEYDDNCLFVPQYILIPYMEEFCVEANADGRSGSFRPPYNRSTTLYVVQAVVRACEGTGHSIVQCNGYMSSEIVYRVKKRVYDFCLGCISNRELRWCCSFLFG